LYRPITSSGDSSSSMEATATSSGTALSDDIVCIQFELCSIALRIVKSGPSRNPSFLKAYFTISRPQKKRKVQPGGEAASPPACKIGAFIGLHGHKRILKERIWLGSRFDDYR
jgi:hypothetical protein